MLEKLYSSTDNLARHRDGPFAEDRDRYLDHCARAGFSIGFLRVSARTLLGIASELDASPGRSMTLGQIQAAADRWLHCRPRCMGR